MIKKRPHEIARDIANAIEADIEDRSGLGDEWRLIEPPVRKEIRAEWRKIINKIFRDNA